MIKAKKAAKEAAKLQVAEQTRVEQQAVNDTAKINEILIDLTIFGAI